MPGVGLEDYKFCQSKLYIYTRRSCIIGLSLFALEAKIVTPTLEESRIGKSWRLVFEKIISTEIISGYEISERKQHQYSNNQGDKSASFGSCLVETLGIYFFVGATTGAGAPSRNKIIGRSCIIVAPFS